LFYLFLLTVAVTAGVVKYSFFPAPSAGVAEMLVVLVLWGLLWWLERQPDELSSLRRMRSLSTAPPRLLWLLQTGTDGEAETNGSLNSTDADEPAQSAADKASGASPQEGGLHG
jgi:hypothetical protein